MCARERKLVLVIYNAHAHVLYESPVTYDLRPCVLGGGGMGGTQIQDGTRRRAMRPRGHVIMGIMQ